MKEWGVPFHVIEKEWTDDQFCLMVEKLGERIERENKAQKTDSNHSSRPENSGSVRRTAYTQEQAQQIASQGHK